MRLFGKERLAFLVIEKLRLAKQIFHLREEKGEKNWSENKGKYWEPGVSRFIRKLRRRTHASVHAKNLPRACVRAGVCCTFSLQPELLKARPDLSRCPLTDFYATIIR